MREEVREIFEFQRQCILDRMKEEKQSYLKKYREGEVDREAKEAMLAEDSAAAAAAAAISSLSEEANTFPAI